MRRPFFITILIYIFSTSFSSSNDNYNYKFEHFSVEDGLSHTHVQAICEDTTTGFLWIGARYGLSRYDGYEFKIYGKDKFKTDELPDSASVNVISDICLRKNGDLLVATEEGGIFKLNRDLDCFEPYLNKNQDFPYLRVNRLFEDTKERLWIGYAKEIGIGRSDDGHKIKIVEKTNYVNDIYEDSKQTIWVSSDDGLFVFYGSEQKYHFQKGKRITTVAEWSTDTLLAGTADSGLFLMKNSLKCESAIKQTHKDFYNRLINSPGVGIKSIIKIGNLIWIGTADGMYCYSIETKKLTPFKEKEGLSHPVIMRMKESKNNVLWIGLLHSGMNKLNLNKPVFTHVNKGKSINTIFKDGKNLWIGFESGEGIDKLDKNTLKLQDSGFSSKIQTQLNNSSVTGIIEYSPDSLLICTWEQGLFYLNKKTNECTKLTYKASEKIRKDFEKTSLWHVIKDAKNRIWIASMDGVFRIENNTLELVAKDKKCWYLFKDSDETIWLGTQNGLFHYSPENKKESQRYPIPGDYITFMAAAEDKDNNQLWVATLGGGVCLFDKKDKKIICHYTEDHGLPNNVVQSLGLDKNKNLWIATINGLCVIEREEVGKEKPNIITFNESQGVQMQYQTRAFFKDPVAETLYFGGTNGLNVIYGYELDSIKNDIAKKDSIKITVTGFQLFAKKNGGITGNDSMNTQKAISRNSIIELRYGQQISLQFAVIDFVSNKEYQYSYSIIKGNDATDWRTMDKSRTVNFNESYKFYGDYTLRIKVETKDGRAPKIKNISLHISPPLWAKWWFIVCVSFLGMLLILSGIMIFIRLRERKLRLQNIKLDNEVRRKTSEITGINEELKKMNDSKNKFFGIISHDLKNPVKSLNMLFNQLETVEKEHKNDLLKVIHEETEKTGTLLENLLQWSLSQMNMLKPNMQRTELNAEVKTIIDNLKQIAGSKRVRLVNLIPQDMFVLADVNILSVIIRNLIHNSIKYSYPDSDVTISAVRNGDFVEISVADKGAGISEKNQEKIFHLDAKLQTRGTASESGTGLGLILVHEFVEMSGGKIRFQSETGKGSIFTFSLKNYQDETTG